MVQEERDMIHYVMLYNDNESQPKKPEGCEDGIIRGAYLIKNLWGGWASCEVVGFRAYPQECGFCI